MRQRPAATFAAGALVLTGAGLNVSVSQSPGSFGASIGVTTLTVADTTGTTNGWAITATYSPPATGRALGGSNVEVTGSSVVPDPLLGVAPANVTLATAAPLSQPVTVASTTTHSGAGTTSLTVSLNVRIPATAVAGTTYGGTVTYTVASVR